MIKSLFALILTAACLSAFTAGAHAVEICDPATGCEFGWGTADPAADHQSADHQDCPCPAHHNHCSHHPIMSGRDANPVSFFEPVAVGYAGEAARGIKSPDLDGPFQPPKV